MRTRNAETPKSRATKKTPVRKSATKTPPKPSEEPPESSTTTPKSADSPNSASVTEPKPSNNSSAAATPTPTTVSVPQSKVEDSGASTDTAQATPEMKATPTTRAITKKSPGKTKTNVAAKASATQTPKTAVKVEQSVVNVEESSAKEETASEMVVETLPKGKPLIQELGQSPKKEETLEEVAVVRVQDSPKKEEPVVVNLEEVVKEDLRKKTAPAEDAKEPESDPVSMEGDVEENVGGEDAEPNGDANVVDEVMQDLGEQEGLEEPVDEECAEDDVLPSEEEAMGLEEEQMEISAVAKERKMKKEQEIFVGGLDRDAVEEDVKKAFEKIGEVVEVRLHRNLSTNKNKGYAFVKFADKEQATRALLELKNPVIRGKRCGIAHSEDNDTLFLGNICNTWTKEAIKQKLREYGVEGVESVTLVPDAQHEGLSRGFVFLEFSCHADAMLAYKRLQKPDVIFGHAERTAKVAFAEPLREPDPEVMAEVKSVFVDGLPPYWDEDRVKEHFKGYGEIERIMLARNMSTAKRKDFGFVDFATHEAAVACVSGVNNTELGDGKSKAKVKARLANPLPKTQAVKGGMRGGFRIGHIGSGAFTRYGRGFGRGGRPFAPMNFQRGRSFYPRGRGRTGRFGFSAGGDHGHAYSDFHGRQPFGGRGGRRGFFRGTHQAPVEEFVPRAATSSRFDRPRRGAFERGRGKQIQSRRPPFSPEREFGGPFGARHFVDEPYMYDSGRGIKRPFSMMDQDPMYMEPSRLRARYDYPDPAMSSRGTHFRGLSDSLGDGGDLYGHDYYGSDYAGGAYSSLYGGDHAYGGGYYY